MKLEDGREIRRDRLGWVPNEIKGALKGIFVSRFEAISGGQYHRVESGQIIRDGKVKMTKAEKKAQKKQRREVS